MKNEESNRIIKMEIIAIKLYNWLSLRSPNFVSSLFVQAAVFLGLCFLYAKILIIMIELWVEAPERRMATNKE